MSSEKSYSILDNPLLHWKSRLYILLIVGVLSSALIINDGKHIGLQLVNDVEHGNIGFLVGIALFNIMIAYLSSMFHINSVEAASFDLRKIILEFLPFLIHPLTIMFIAACAVWVYAALESVYPNMKVILAIVLLIIQLFGTIATFIFLIWISQKFHWISQFVLKYNYGVILTVFLSLSSVFYDYTFLAAISFNYSPFIGLPFELFLF